MWSFEYYAPTKIVFGSGRLREIGNSAGVFGDCTVIITGRAAMRTHGFLAEATDALEMAGVEVAAVVEGTPPNPTSGFINGVTARLAEQADRIDAVIGLGGGSSLDAAKAVAFCLRNPGDVWDYCNPAGKKPPQNVPLPVIAAPSTAGTGSETSMNAVLTNPAAPAKVPLAGPWLFPRVALVDPRLASKQPPRLAAATAVDAFSHLFENYTQKMSDPITDLLNLEGMRLVCTHLPPALKHPETAEHWEALALASMYGGMVLGVSGAHVGHALEHPISARTDVAHGEGLAALLPGLMERLENALPERVARVVELLPAGGGLAERFVQFLEAVGLRVTLPGLGVHEDDFETIADDALATMKGAVAKAPFEAGKSALVHILERSQRLLERG